MSKHELAYCSSMGKESLRILIGLKLFGKLIRRLEFAGIF